MRLSLFCLAAIAFTGLTAAAADDAKAIVEKARKATGWDKRTSPHMTWKEKGKFSAGGQSMNYDGTFHVSNPDKLRFDLEIKAGDMPVSFTAAVDGDKAWGKAMGRVEDIVKDKLEYMQTEVYAMSIVSLPAALTEKDYTLAKIDDASVDGKKCVGVSVKKTGKPEVKLWFDAESGLPAKVEFKTKNEFDGWKECTDEMFPSDWADGTNGKMFKKMKILRNGQPMIESELSDLKMPDKVDAKLYEKPAQ